MSEAHHPVFHVFPHGIDSSLLVPVLLGLVVQLAFTEWWGWDFVGVVVPGYLCAVAQLQPAVAAVVVLEAALTFGLCRALDALATRAGLWFPVFGRDRFYFILVMSILARLIFEGGAPALLGLGAGTAHSTWPWPGLWPRPDGGQIFGIGLVLVPLTANRFWRAGLGSGTLQLGVETLFVGLGLAALTRLTNFTLSGFELSFDRLALAFLSSPLTQITLLVTAAIASACNRRFGWDAHGILVPALLGLVVLAPLRMATTLGEAAMVATLVSALVKLPGVRDANLEAGRKVVLCFGVGFAVKLGVATVAEHVLPGYRPADLFGFGYLMPSLLAERIVVKQNLPLVLLPTAQVAAAGVPLAAALAGLLVWATPDAGRAGGREAAADLFATSRSASAEAERTVLVAAAPLAPAAAERLLLERTPDRHFVRPPPPQAIEEAVARIVREDVGGDPRGMADALRPLGLRATRAAGRGMLLDGPGWPRVGLRAATAPTSDVAAGAPVILAPHPGEIGAAEAGLSFAQSTGGDCVLGGPVDGDGAAQTASSLAVALAAARHAPLVVVRGAELGGRMVGDVLVMFEPTPVAGSPPWFAGVARKLWPRFAPARIDGDAAAVAALRAFPAGTVGLEGVAIVWLGPRARRALTEGGAGLDAPEYLAVARARGLGVVRTPVERWLSAARSSTGFGPDAGFQTALERLEQQVIAADPQLLGPAHGPGAFAERALVIDESRHLAGLGLVAGAARAWVVAGDRRETRAVVRSAAELAAALDRGDRTLIWRDDAAAGATP